MGKWKKLTAFAPALAVVIVAACAGISLNGYTAPVYAVEQPEALVTPEPEQDTDVAEKKDNTKEKDDTKKTTDTEAELVAAVGSGSFASFFVSARMAFVFFKIGCSRSGTAMPIIVPP